ncbi:kinetochore protein NUF2-like [Agrilus planipennis]|uniref:Kinetochore protein NUF2-like n=1 Tax=Agrilus planipennis TaxID=224129 RepID=A0A1W4XF13_AGRPL|nr:kinetochore protein NUF2-like [Agrilus planipennis]
MNECEDELQVILDMLQTYLPNFQVSKSDFQQPSSNFVVTLYANLINKIIEDTAGDNMEDPAPFKGVINLNDEETSIFTIFDYISSIYNHLGYQFFNLTDLYCPSAKRTKCVCKTLLMFLENLDDASEAFSEIENRVLQEAICEKNNYNLKNDLQRELSEKANSVGALKTESDKLVLEYSEMHKKESDLKLEHEQETKNILLEQVAVNQKMEMLTIDEDGILRLEKEQAMLQEEVVNTEEVENVKDSIEKIHNHICQLEEEIVGFEGCLECKRSELNAYEEVYLKLEKFQHTEISELEKLHKLRLSIKNLEEQISLADKTLLELKASKVKHKEKTKQLKKDIIEKELVFTNEKRSLSSKLQSLEENKKQKEKLVVHLQEQEKNLIDQLNSVKKDLEIMDKEGEEMHELFREACSEIIVSTNNTTEAVRRILTGLESKVYQVHGS